MAQKLGRNDPCWCGSGKKYKKCHLNRKSDPPLPLEAIDKAARAVWRHKQCLHPQAAVNVCNKVVSAHTVQRSGTLGRIVDSTNHVRTFYPIRKDPVGKPILRTVGWRQASTFTGFCAKHDSETFAPLESAQFTGSEEQCFLVGYRALCHEVYQKSGSLRANPVLRQLVDRGHCVEMQRELQETYAVIDAGTRKGLASFQKLKAVMDEQLLNAKYSGWSRVVIVFRGELCVASTGTVSPNRDLEGTQLQVAHNPHAAQESLLYGVVAVPGGGAVVLTWRSLEKAPKHFVESLFKEGEQKSARSIGAIHVRVRREHLLLGGLVGFTS